MTKIVGLDAHIVRMPLRHTFRTSNKSTSAASLVLVELTTDAGVSGWGEAALNPSFTDETPDRVRADLREVAAALDGQDAGTALALLPELSRRFECALAVQCAVSIALWDLHARVLDVPLFALFGAPCRTSVPTVYQLGNFDAEADAQEAVEAAAAGFDVVKLKVGRPDVTDDLKAVEKVRAALGSAPRIYVDVNQAWDRQQAAEFLRHAPGLGVRMVEQPLARDDLSGLSQLATETLTLAADESVFSATELLDAIAAGTQPGGVVVKQLKAGGIEGAWDLMLLCRLAGVEPFPAGMPGDTSIVSAAMLNLAVVIPDLPLGTAITPHCSAEDVVRDPLPVRRGQLTLESLHGPGLGVEVDRDRVCALATD